MSDRPKHLSFFNGFFRSRYGAAPGRGIGTRAGGSGPGQGSLQSGGGSSTLLFAGTGQAGPQGLPEAPRPPGWGIAPLLGAVDPQVSLNSAPVLQPPANRTTVASASPHPTRKTAGEQLAHCPGELGMEMGARGQGRVISSGASALLRAPNWA